MEDGYRNHWDQVAQKYWSNSIPKKVDPEVLQAEIWTPIESDGFTTQSLLPLENLQVLERFLWPTFTENASNQHVILIAAFVHVKRQANLSPWAIFSERQDDFSILFHRVLSLNLDSTLPITSSLFLLGFVISAFQSLENDFVRKECAPLVAISIWHNLHKSSRREKELQSSSTRQKAWRSAQKRFDSSDRTTQVKSQFDRAWLYSMVLNFFRRLNPDKTPSTGEVIYCERFLEFLIDLISQLPTRRYSIVLLTDLNVLPVLRTTQLSAKGEHPTLSDLTDLYQHFVDFRVDEPGPRNDATTGEEERHSALAQLQKIAFQNFEEKLKVLALSNYASIDKADELKSHLSTLSDLELEKLCDLLDLRTSYPQSSGISSGRALFLQTLITTYCKSESSRSVIRSLSILPTEESLYDPTLLRNETYDGTKPMALPKLNLQYLSLDDFMWRSFKLHQNEAFYEIRKDMESIVRRMKPRVSRDSRATTFEGFSKMALPIEKPAIIEVGPPKVGSITPGFVRAEIVLDVSRLSDRIRSEWESLRPKDTVFLLAAKGKDDSRLLTNGNALNRAVQDRELSLLRTAEVVHALDDNGKPLRETSKANGYHGRAKKRRLLLDLDPVAYHMDQERLSRGKPNIWNTINIVARRQGRENNFKPVLETIQKLVGAGTELPSWFQEVFLGYGDSKSASYFNMSNKVEDVDFLDTFLDWEHLQHSFAERTVSAADGSKALTPPYRLQLFPQGTQLGHGSGKKRRREQMENESIATAPIQASTYKPQNTGPYPADIPRKNSIRFTPNQVSAIVSGTQPGLSLIIGPPGTGKTDVATQIINLLYHNFPHERILLVAHSNQALNQLFQKIIAVDIDPRHLLRLGHGEEELDTEVSYGKYGRIESFLENRQYFLGEVDRLAASIGAAGAHGSTCETADYFNKVHVQSAWSRFWSIATSDTASPQMIIDSFPFKRYFSNAPVPELLPASATASELREVAQGCKYHLDKIFAELESIRPFEILRNPRDQANHLLVKEARIIAMTSTHAAMRRSEIAELGFHYDTLIMEEAAQITEVESFIPCVLQNPDLQSGQVPLKRVVLVGDHLQNSPVIQNLALRQYARFEQSLFLRLVRLGVPTITLDQQGRCRPSIANLFSWRYESLTNLPHLTSLPEFQRANTGFRYEYQFIDVPDYQGEGEREPTPHFIQNLGEAEYTVALYQYMRLLGYPARSISILATYAGQKALIRDVLEHRCKGNRLFGMPKIVTTVDKYQGEQNDYVLLSLVRTKSVGYLRDVRRLTVALSRARLGLYIFGRRELFENCFEMNTAMERLSIQGKPEGKLEIVTGEMFPTARQVADDVVGVEMDGIEHLGQYVYEMTQAKIKSLGGVANIMFAEGDTQKRSDEHAEHEVAEELDLEEDPLHENV